MESTSFQKKNGTISSIRTSIGSGNSKVSLTNYTNSTRGGVTFRTNTITSRIDNQGQCISTGFNAGRKMTYIGSHNQITNRITPF
nr:hypothetical protein [Lysinibacillus timonensis]